jgi:hypothetical protein
MTRIERAQSEVYRSAECQRDEPRTPSGTNGTDGFGRRIPSCKDGLLARASSHGHRRPHASMHDIFRWRHPECLREGAQKVQSAIASRLRQVFQGNLLPHSVGDEIVCLSYRDFRQDARPKRAGLRDMVLRDVGRERVRDFGPINRSVRRDLRCLDGRINRQVYPAPLPGADLNLLTLGDFDCLSDPSCCWSKVRPPKRSSASNTKTPRRIDVLRFRGPHCARWATWYAPTSGS